MICTVCEDVQRPGCYELPLGTPLRVLIDELGGGLTQDERSKPSFPGRPTPF
ncbi:hypothetical protein C2W62_30520 [Candidatus Entotheonella serta]|nr:hypothetical protein C2W62_30520 [Candidatus Entotheonella serta]